MNDITAKPLSKKKQRELNRQIAMDAHYKIYKHIIHYLVGPKFKGAKYQIGDVHSKSRAFGMVRINTGYIGCDVSIYFYVTHIHVYVRYMPHDGRFDVDYDISDFQNDFELMPLDINAYTLRTQTFLQELLRHVTCIDSSYDCYQGNIHSYEDCISDKVPDDFDVPFGVVPVILHEYVNYAVLHPYVLDYMIKVFKSKNMKRYRGELR